MDDAEPENRTYSVSLELKQKRTLEKVYFYIDIRLLGSAQLMADDSRPLAVRCVSVFKDLLSLMQSQLLEIATDPQHDGSGMEEVSAFADLVVRKSTEITSREITEKSAEKKSSSVGVSAAVSKTPSLSANASTAGEASTELQTSYSEALRDTVVFAEVAIALNDALAALGIENLYILIDEWTAIPPEIQPYIAEFLKRAFFPSSRLTVKIASLEYRSRFITTTPNKTSVGFELGGDLSANLDLDDYYVYDRNPAQVVEMFLELLYRHVDSELQLGYLQSEGMANALQFRARFFTEPATFVELVRAGEGVVRDFLGIFHLHFFAHKGRGGKKLILILSRKLREIGMRQISQQCSPMISGTH